MPIRNRTELLDHGTRGLRSAAIDIVEHALLCADPYWSTRKLVRLEGQTLAVGDLQYDLSKRGKIWVLGAGKATFRIAQALDEILGSRIERGVVAVNRAPMSQLKHIEVLVAGHPIPDESSYRAALEVMTCAEAAGPGDIVFAAITGGSSALLCLPATGITLGEKREIHQLLLNCGANILAINAVRKHLSRIKGGLLARAIHPAEVINLTVSDVVGDPLDFITDVTVADTSSVADAIDVLKRYDLWDRVSTSVREHLNKGNQVETPKTLDPHMVHSFLLVPLAAACEAARGRAEALGFTPLVLTTAMEGESQEVGIFLGTIAKEIARNQRPVAPPCAVVVSGEATVTVPDTAGSGGPSQELALGAAVKMQGMPHVALASIDTDGFDGPTDIAGALVDGSTVDRARALGYEPLRQLRMHNAAPLLLDVKDAMFTGATGTNIADLVVMLVRNGDGADDETLDTMA